MAKDSHKGDRERKPCRPWEILWSIYITSPWEQEVSRTHSPNLTIQLGPTSVLKDKLLKLEEILNGRVPPFKGPLPGPRRLWQKKFADVKQMCSVNATGEFLTFQEVILTTPSQQVPQETSLCPVSLYNSRRTRARKTMKHQTQPCVVLSLLRWDAKQSSSWGISYSEVIN